jgi:ribosome-associated protein
LPKDTDSKEKALLISNLALEKKAEGVTILDMQKVSSFCDYFVIASAGSLKKISAIAEHIVDSLALRKIRPFGAGARKDNNWVILDYSDVVTHIFYYETRRFYGLERLWGDAERIEVESG